MITDDGMRGLRAFRFTQVVKLFIDTVNPVQSTVAVGIKHLVTRGALANPHHQHIGIQKLYLIAAMRIYLQNQTFHFRKIHAEIINVSLVQQSPRQSIAAGKSLLLGLSGIMKGRIQILIAPEISLMIQGIHFSAVGLGRTALTRYAHKKDTEKGDKDQSLCPPRQICVLTIPHTHTKLQFFYQLSHKEEHNKQQEARKYQSTKIIQI